MIKVSLDDNRFLIQGNRFKFLINRFKIAFHYYHSGLPWYGSRKDIKIEFNFIPEDEEFWNHLLWVIPNPDFINRFLHPFYMIHPNSNNGYFVLEVIPF